MNKSFIFNSWLKRITPWGSDWAPIDLEKKEKLQSPFITIIQDPIDDFKIEINFDSVPNAELYKIFANGKNIASITSLSYLYEAPQNGNYSIYVKAYDGKDFSSSNKSNVIIVNVTSLADYLVNNAKKYILANLNKIKLKLE